MKYQADMIDRDFFSMKLQAEMIDGDFILPSLIGGGESRSDYETAAPDRYVLLKDFARENRKNMTEAERILWNELKNEGLGHKFLRQHIIGDYK